MVLIDSPVHGQTSATLPTALLSMAQGLHTENHLDQKQNLSATHYSLPYNLTVFTWNKQGWAHVKAAAASGAP